MPPKKIAGIVLAAGGSQRFGTPKQLALLVGKPLLAWAVGAARASRLGRIYVVLGARHRSVADAVVEELSDERVQVVFNPDYRSGMAASLKAGLAAAGAGWHGAMFLLGDQPLAGSGLIDRLIGRFRVGREDICLPVFESRRGHPVLFDRCWFDQLAGIAGDRGARDILAAHPQRLRTVEVQNPNRLLDVDTARDLEQLEQVLGEFPGARQ